MNFQQRLRKLEEKKRDREFLALLRDYPELEVSEMREWFASQRSFGGRSEADLEHFAVRGYFPEAA